MYLFSKADQWIDITIIITPVIITCITYFTSERANPSERAT
jgi:hypothetical protein